jgi:F0F1-type ATP synthase membrane subunit c/vacuolar-type H+-ATPase subunit K
VIGGEIRFNMDPQTAPSLSFLVKSLRTIWLGMLASIVLLVGVAEKSAPKSHGRTNWILFEVIAGVVGAIAIASMAIRRRYIGRALPQLVEDPTDTKALKRWQTGHIIHFALSESMPLYGLVLRYQGFTLPQVAAFYFAGIGFMVLGYPKDPRSNAHR